MGFGEPVIYQECESSRDNRFLAILNATWQSKEFYVVDYTREKPATDDLKSTIYWNHLVTTDDTGEASLEFFSSDMTGDFLIHVAGFSKAGPLHGSGSFVVTRDEN